MSRKRGGERKKKRNISRREE